MEIEVSTDNSIDGSEHLTAVIKDLVQKKLSHMEPHISRIEVHLSDPSAGTAGQAERHCMLEARLKGKQPTVVTHTASTIELATSGAASKMNSALGSILGKQTDHH